MGRNEGYYPTPRAQESSEEESEGFESTPHAFFT